MARIAGVNIPNQKRVPIGLTYIHEGVAHPEIRKMAFDYVTNDVMPSLEAETSPYPLDLAAYREEKQRELNQVGWVDAASGVAHVPIDLAMTMQLQSQLQRRAAASGASR